MSHRPRKRFGQNFLRDRSVIERILSVIDPRPGQHLVEIGPGQGALTQGLLQRAGALDALELDRDLIAPLVRHCGPHGELRVHNADALRFDFATLRKGDQRLRVVGNLPYNISTPLLFHLIDQIGLIQDMHFMLQREVVARMAAAPGSKAYGRLSVMLQLGCEVTPLFDIGPESFDPPPKVDSSLVRLRPLPEPALTATLQAEFSRFLAIAFGQRRKTLRNNLKGLVDNDAIMALDIDPSVRSEMLGIGQLLRLFQASRAAISPLDAGSATR